VLELRLTRLASSLLTRLRHLRSLASSGCCKDRNSLQMQSSFCSQAGTDQVKRTPITNSTPEEHLVFVSRTGGLTGGGTSAASGAASPPVGPASRGHSRHCLDGGEPRVDRGRRGTGLRVATRRVSRTERNGWRNAHEADQRRGRMVRARLAGLSLCFQCCVHVLEADFRLVEGGTEGADYDPGEALCLCEACAAVAVRL
jgi:hypothetical protein